MHNSYKSNLHHVQSLCIQGVILNDGGSIGAFFEDRIRDIIGSVDGAFSYGSVSGTFSLENYTNGIHLTQFGVSGYHAFEFKASKVVPVANENRSASLSLQLTITY